MSDFRQLMMRADKDFQQYLKSGKKQHPFKDADKEWNAIKKLHKKVSRVISAHGLWRKGEHIEYPGYRTLMAYLYLKWVTLLPVRRLEYVDTRFISPEAYGHLTITEREQSNWLVTGKRWAWELFKYKTYQTFNHQTMEIPLGLRNALRKIRPIANAKNAKGYIFLNSKWGPLSRNAFSGLIKQVYKKYLNKKYTQNTIRAIKVSSVWGKSIKTLDVLQLSEGMAHSLTTQLLHYRANDNSETSKDVRSEPAD